jgi:hypothetical protein
MNKSELMSRLDEIINMEDSFVEELASMDITSSEHSHFPVTTFLRLKSGFRKLQDDTRRHKEIISNLRTIIAGDPREEY